MEKFIGTKIVQAEPAMKCWGHKGEAHDAGLILTQKEFFEKVADGWEATEIRHGYAVVYEDGYRSWSPADVFEAAYRRTDGMNFGLAIEAAKMGKKISRAGWNGKGMWVVYRTGYPEGIPANKNTADAVGIQEGELFKVRPYLQMKCVDGSFQMWLASQSDILADDWYIVED